MTQAPNDSAKDAFPHAPHSALWAHQLQGISRRLKDSPPLIVEGRLTRMVGLTLEAIGCQAAIGARCLVESIDGNPVEAEVVGFSGEYLYLMPTGEMHGIRPNARVIPTGSAYTISVSDDLLGRVLDGSGRPLDGKGPIRASEKVPLNGRHINPLARDPIKQPLDVGVRAINALFSVGRGQRMGLVAGSGVGKSVLLGMMTRFSSADVIVVGLIGERGREVKEFIENILGEAGMARAVVVAVPADHAPVMRMHGAYLATAIAEYFRDKGRHVLLLMDSLTRFAQAQREIALAIGEPPATKGYPPSVFARIPQLVERAGNGENGKGSITAFYTVLVEGDDNQDPIGDSSRAILDGHIVLSRELAEAGLYPAINVELSISRLMNEIASPEHIAAAVRFRQMNSTYQQNRDLISVGAYAHGSDPRIDEAIRAYPRIQDFIRQDHRNAVNLEQSLHDLGALLQSQKKPDKVPQLLIQ
ncbi:MAG: flagellar protein export ATPase FliI [Gammaproteobacteria bacterium]|nr:flagellar protein export ATPase FliI [Gammaproteobacteria bacterium]MDH5652940.1 flagellar protein export ATPase FliI [Gammaproteobacteria bacterium]